MALEVYESRIVERLMCIDNHASADRSQPVSPRLSYMQVSQATTCSAIEAIIFMLVLGSEG